MTNTQETRCSAMVRDRSGRYHDGAKNGFRRCERTRVHAHPQDAKSALCTQHFLQVVRALKQANINLKRHPRSPETYLSEREAGRAVCVKCDGILTLGEYRRGERCLNCDTRFRLADDHHDAIADAYLEHTA